MQESGTETILAQLEAGLARIAPPACRAAVLVPFVTSDNGPCVLFEVRAAHLAWQPGEVCLPGGHIESGEADSDAAVREACEELLLQPGQVTNLIDLGRIEGPGGMPVHLFAGSIDNYEGTFDATEVGSTFTVPVSWFMENEPAVYKGKLVLNPPDDLPWHLIPQGRNYPWHAHAHEVPFYEGAGPVIWGFTARVIRLVVGILKAGA